MSDDENTEDLRLSIDQFVELMRTLLAEDNSPAFIHLVLAGTFEGRHVAIDALENRLYTPGDEDVEEDDLYPYDVSRDVDSVLGMADNICVYGKHLVFHILHKYSDSLTKDVGITRSIRYRGISYQVDLHRIANIGFAKWGVRNEIRIFFPGLWVPKMREHHRIEIPEAEAFYRVLRGVINDLLPNNRGGNLAPDLGSEMFRSRAANGTLTFGGRVLDEDSAAQLGECLRDAIDNAIADGEQIEWARGFFFLHQIRGVKDGHPHSPDRADEAFRAFLDDHGLSEEALDEEPDNWFFDIGVEISSTNKDDSIAWRTDSHFHLLHEVCGIDHIHSKRLTSMGSTLYYRDFTSHLVDVAGCRVDTGVGPARGRLGILRMQAYQSDKSLTANPAEGNGFHAKHTTLSQLIDKNNPAFFDGIYKIYENSEQQGIISNARIEVRLPYAFQHLFYGVGNEADWRRWVVAIPCEAWWGIRYLPIVAYKMVADLQFRASPVVRTNLRAVTLLAGITWLANSLHATPDTGPSSRQLLSVVLPRVPRRDIDDRNMPYRISKPTGRIPMDVDMGFEELNRMTPTAAVNAGGAFENRMSPNPAPYPFNGGPDEERDNELVPAYLRGYIFLFGILYDQGNPVPIVAFSGAGYLSETAFQYLYGATFQAFRDYIYNGDLFTKGNPSRTRNRVRQLVFIPPPNTSIPTVFNLPGGDRTLPTMDFGAQGMDDSDSDDGGADLVTRNEFLSKIYHQLMVDVIAVSPNPKRRSLPSYCTISNEHRDMVTDDIFKDKNVGKYLRIARMKIATSDEWTSAFNHLLPAPGSDPKPAKAQNYPHARKDLKKMFDQLAWFPWAKSDRIWETNSKKDAIMTLSPGLEEKKPGPHILTRRGWRWDGSVVWKPIPRPAQEPQVIEISDNSDDDDDDGRNSHEIIDVSD
ncbi:hypothetical protein FA13DRAFT_1714375 [Coprinellus micaceus]|uniref:Uncharacterized protein n=1 Tax=Coprinellus micaceus TaxID=71717 RepID=A0A4Y7SK64_COPMI|nr:hypothetical protein FA13DRAFT_1716389 [Coprinellus micaceus]TEB24918.1 hypothetical protein FA13DRAFT_1714375 [Coprinellus micaceus]